MRLIIILLLLSVNCFGTTYYVSNTGSNAANGTTTGTSWQTIAKVNSSTTSGDTVLFKCGDTWNEKLNVPGSNMYFGSYSTGVKPLITGFQNLTGLTNVGNIWSATASGSVLKQNAVLVNGKLSGKARFPNTGYLAVNSTTQTTISTSTLTGTPNYSGAECVARTTHWIIDVCKIKSQSSNVLTLQEPLSKAGGFENGGAGYFLQNDVRFLDIQNEWVYDSASRLISIYSTTLPVVKYSNIDTLVFVSKKDNLTFNGIDFQGANVTAFQIDTSYRVSVINCTIKEMGGSGIKGIKNSRFTLKGDTLINIFDNGLSFFMGISPNNNLSDSCLFENNYLKNVGFLAGMGASNNVHYEGIMNIGHSTSFINNRLDSIGYCGIYFNGRNNLIKNNYITNFCFNKDDGGAIYSGLGGAVANNGTVIRSNITINGIGASAGSVNNYGYAAGIYLDQLNNDVWLDSNTTSNSFIASINFHNCDSGKITNNLSLNNIGYPISLHRDALSNMKDFEIRNNIFYSSNSIQPSIYVNAATTNFGVLNNNYYLRPISPTNNMQLNLVNYSLPAWKTATSQDANSFSSLQNVTSDLPLFFFNPTLSDSTINLAGTYINGNGVIYNNSIKLKPYGSALLFKATYNIITTSIQFKGRYKLNRP